MPKDYINILFLLFSPISHLFLSLTHFPLFLPLLYHLFVSPSYHYHSPNSRFTLQSTELHRDHQPSLKPISKSSPQSTDLHYDHQQTLIPTRIAKNSHRLCHIGPRFVLQFHRWRSVWWHDWVGGRRGGFLDRWWWVFGFGVVVVVVVDKIRGGG